MSKIVNEVESYKRTYDGSFENFNKFSNELKIILKPKTSIAEYLLDGTVEVTKKERGLKASYRQKNKLLTSIELLHMVVRQKLRDGGTPDVGNSLDHSSKEIQDLIKEVLKDASETTEKKRLKDPNQFYPLDSLVLKRLSKHPEGKLSEAIPWVELIEQLEASDAYARRTADNIWATHELDEAGAFNTIAPGIAGKIIRSGIIPSQVINEAIGYITDIVSKKLSDEAKEISKLENPETGELFDGFKIYQILSNPTTNQVKNLIITAGNLYSERGSMTSEEHLRLTFNNCRNFQRAIESLDTVLPHSYIIGLGNWIRQFPDDSANDQALKTDVLSKDISTLSKQEVLKCAQIRTPLTSDDLNASESNRGEPEAVMYLDRSDAELQMLHNGFVANSRSVLCFACKESGHIVRNCTNTAALEQWKRDKPDQFRKFGKLNIPCKFGKNCNRKGRGCRYTHKSGSGQANAANSHEAVDSDANPETGLAWFAGASVVKTDSPPCGSPSEYGLVWDEEPLTARASESPSSSAKSGKEKGFGKILTLVLMLVCAVITVKSNTPFCLLYLIYFVLDLTLLPHDNLHEGYIAHGYQQDQDQSQMCWAKKLILDSGANRHMTGNRNILSNITAYDMNFNTANGSVRTSEKGDITTTVRDVIFNPRLGTTLISVYQLCKDNAKAIVFTTKGAWSFDPSMLSKEQLSKFKQTASVINGTYTIMPLLMDPPIKITNEKDILRSNSLYSEAHTFDAHWGSHDVIDKNPLHTWHCRLGHPSIELLEQYVRNRWIDIPNFKHLTKLVNTISCVGCQRAASINHKHPRKDERTRNATRGDRNGQIIHVDIMYLPIDKKVATASPQTSMLRKTMAVVAVDSTSDFSWIVYISNNTTSALQSALQIILSKIKSDGYTPQKLRSDGEKGVFSDSTKKLLREKYQVEVELTADSQQNLAEMKIKALRHKAKHMMKHRFLSVEFTHRAFTYANLLLILEPKSRLGGRTTYQEWYGRPPTRQLNRCRTFGSIVFFHKKTVSRKKHDSTRELIFTGFASLDGPYTAVDPKTNGFNQISSWHGIFDESMPSSDWLSKIRKQRLRPGPTWPPERTMNSEPPPPLSTSEGVEKIEIEEKGHEENSEEEEEDIGVDAVESKVPETIPANTTARKSSRTNAGRAPQRLSPSLDARKSYTNTQAPNMEIPSYYNIAEDNFKHMPEPQTDSSVPSYYISGAFMAIATCTSFLSDSLVSITSSETKRHPTLIKEHYPKAQNIEEPKTLKQAMKSQYWPEWSKGIEIELNNLKDHNTFRIEDRKPNTRTIGTKYVFKVKQDKNGEATQFKVRLVAKGYNQIYQEHFDKTFAPVAFLSSILLLIVLAVHFGLDLFLLDFKGDFLHSVMPKQFPVYIDTPHGFAVPPHKVIRLHKSLYGTKNAGHLWWNDLRTALIDQGFTQCTYDQCVFWKRENNKTTYLATWVDDVIIATNDPHIDELKKLLKSKGFSITTFEELNWYLGLSITQNTDGSVTIDQSAYIDNMLHTFGMTDAHAVSTPLPPEGMLPIDVDSPTIDTKVVPYRSLIGALSHLGRFTRSDILFATFYFARFQREPKQAHWIGAKRILRYLKGTANRKIHITRGTTQNLQLEAFTDADWGKKESGYKSTSGYTILLNDNPILSVSRTQKATAQSTCESELYAAGIATLDIIWVRRLLQELVPAKLPPTRLYCDNQAVVDNVNNDKNSKGLKHIMLKLRLLRDHQNKHIVVTKIPSKENIADIFTKPLHRGPYEYLRGKLLKVAA